MLEGLSAEGRKTLTDHAVEKRLVAGQTLWSAGDRADGIALVLEGKVRVVRGTGGRQVVIHWDEAGATLGEVPFFTDGVYPATAVAMEPTRVLIFSQAAVKRAMAVDPGIAFFFLKGLSQRVQGLVAKIDQLSANSVQVRLARYILDRQTGSAAVKRRSTSAANGAFSLGMTQNALAEELGTVREVIVRSLRALRDLGAIEPVGDGKYRIASLEVLEGLASEGRGKGEEGREKRPG
jgi:CRP-like cAMP-binding protein